MYSYLVNKTLIILKSILKSNIEVSILLQEGVQLQCLQIHRMWTLWPFCELNPSMLLVVFILNLYVVGFLKLFIVEFLSNHSFEYHSGFIWSWSHNEKYSIAFHQHMKIRVFAFYLKSLALSFVELHLSKYIPSLKVKFTWIPKSQEITGICTQIYGKFGRKLPSFSDLWMPALSLLVGIET